MPALLCYFRHVPAAANIDLCNLRFGVFPFGFSLPLYPPCIANRFALTIQISTTHLPMRRPQAIPCTEKRSTKAPARARS